MTLASRGVTIEARALPPTPPGFQGAVGQFEFSGYVSPEEAKAGERVRLSLLENPSLPEAVLQRPKTGFRRRWRMRYGMPIKPRATLPIR